MSDAHTGMTLFGALGIAMLFLPIMSYRDFGGWYDTALSCLPILLCLWMVALLSGIVV